MAINKKTQYLGNLRNELKKEHIIPFIGAGFSMHLNLPTWSNLIDILARELGYEPEIFKAQGNAMQLAEYYLIKNGNKITELTEYLENWFNNEGIDIASSEQHMILVDLAPPIIYTTNYDNLIERAFKIKNKPYDLIKNVDDLRNIKPGKTQIIKFHGDFVQNDTIVLTETHYFNRLALESALDIKLRSDLLGKSLVFLGYSFQDINMRYMWYKLNKIWKSQGVNNKVPHQSYFVGFGVGEIQETLLRANFNIVALNLDLEDKNKSIIDFLKYLR